MHHSVIMKLTGHMTAAMFHRYNTVDAEDAREAYQKLDALLIQGGQRGIAERKEQELMSVPHSAPQ